MTEEIKTTEYIPSERRGLWIVATFIIALLALITSLVANFRLYNATVITQTEILLLTNKIQQLEKNLNP